MSAKGKKLAAAKLNTPVKTTSNSPLNTVPGIAAFSLYAAVGRPRHPPGDKTGKAYHLDLQISFLSGALATGIGYFYNKNDQIDFANLAVSPVPVFLLHGSIAMYKGAPYGLHGEGYDFVFDIQSMSLIGYFDTENPHGNTQDTEDEIIEISSDGGSAVDEGSGADGADGEGEGEGDEDEASPEDSEITTESPSHLTYAQVCHPIMGTFFGKVFNSDKPKRVFSMDVGVYVSSGAGFFMKQELDPYKPCAPVHGSWDPARKWHGEGPPVPANGRFVAVFGQIIGIERSARAVNRFHVQVVQIAFAATTTAPSTPLLPNTLDMPSSSKALFATPARTTTDEKENDAKRAATPHPDAPPAKKGKGKATQATAGSGLKKPAAGAGTDGAAGDKTALEKVPAAAPGAPALPNLKLIIPPKGVGTKAAAAAAAAAAKANK